MKPVKSSSNGIPPGIHNATHGNGDTFLPPICVTNKLDSGDNASDEHETDEGTNMVTTLSTSVCSPPRRFRKTKHKTSNNNRHLVNKSSMSDSFVLPLIDFRGSPPTTGNNQARIAGWRENRAATHPERKNERKYKQERGIPLSKSCPILSERRSTQRFNSTDYEDDEFESDDEDSEADMDFKSMSFNVGVRPKLSRNHRVVTFDDDEHAENDEGTHDVLCKLAKLESPRIKDIKSSQDCLSGGDAGTKLPNIFRDRCGENTSAVDKELQHQAKKSLLAKYENGNKQLPLDSRTISKPGAKRHPDLSPTCNSRTLETRLSPSWKLGASSSSSSTTSDSSGGSTNNTLVPSSPATSKSQDDFVDHSDLTTSPNGSKSRRKTKRRQEKHDDLKNSVTMVTEDVPKDNVKEETEAESETADTKCRQWLDENRNSSTS